MLVTDDGDGQNRSALAAVRALALAGYEPVVAVAVDRSLAASSRYCRRAVRVPPVGEPGYADAVRAELDGGGYVTALPASDAALVALCAPGSTLVDKEVLAAKAAAAGVPTVPSRTFTSHDELVDAAGELDFPVVVKPAVKATRTAQRTVRVDSPAGLDGAAGHGRVVVQPYVDEPVRAVAGVVWQGDLLVAVHQRYERIWPPGCGVASAAVTVAPDAGDEDGLLRLLDGYDGIFQAQFVGRHLVDVNPRVYGSLPLAVTAGVNLAGVWCDLRRGRPVERRRARAGVPYRWLEGDLRSLASDLRHRRRRPAGVLAALRPRAGTAHSVESLSDPMPLLTRLRYVASHRR